MRVNKVNIYANPSYRNMEKKMKNLLIVIQLLLLMGVSCTEDSLTNVDDTGDSFSSWMTNSKLISYVNNKMPDNSYILLVEGRLKNGSNEYRVYPSLKPENAFYWYWYYNQTESSFDSLITMHESDSVNLINFQTFTDASNTLRYQVTFRKIIY